MMAFQLMKSRKQVAAGARSVEVIERSLQRANELIEHTLESSRLAAGIELRRQATTLSKLFADAEQAAISEAESRGVRIRLNIERDERVHLDVRLVRSALGNVLRNAVKYTEAGSEVAVRGEVVGERIIIEVADHCGGLAEGNIEKLFAPFVRRDAGQSGFGLGLAIAKQAVDAHGGTIRALNRPGKGCVFVLELPLWNGGHHGN